MVVAFPATNSASARRRGPNKSLVHHAGAAERETRTLIHEFRLRVPRWLRARETKRDRATGEFGEKRERSYLSRLCLLSTRDNRRESLPGMLSRLSSAAAVLTGSSRWFRRVNRVNYADIQLALLAHMRVRLNFDRGESVFNLDRESASRYTSHHHHHREMRVRLPLSNFYSPRSRGLVSLARRIYAPP